MKINLKRLYLFLPLFFLGFVLVFSQAKDTEKATSEKEAPLPTIFERRCSVCHSLERVQVEIEKIIQEMHKKAGVKLSEETLKEIQQSFTLLPREEPHKELFQEKCATCHSLDRVVMAHQTEDETEMNKIIQKMSEKKGSGISKEEIQKIQNSMKILNEIYEEEIEAKPEKQK